MKKLFGIIFFMLLVCRVAAQPTQGSVSLEKDSLKQLLASSQPDTNRVMILSELSIRYFTSNNDTAMKYAQEGLALAQALKFRKGWLINFIQYFLRNTEAIICHFYFHFITRFFCTY